YCRLLPLAVLLGISDTTVAGDSDAPKEASDKFKITTQRADDNVKARGKKGRTKGGKEDAPLDEKSPLGRADRIVGDDSKPAQELPLKDGYFEVALPKALFEGNPKAIPVNWTSIGIDGDIMNLAVDVISDVVCPWCYIGKRRLERAVAAVDGPVRV